MLNPAHIRHAGYAPAREERTPIWANWLVCIAFILYLIFSTRKRRK